MARLSGAALLLGSLAACSFQHGSLTTGDSGAGGDDAPRDSRSGDTPLDACATFSTHLDTCMPMVTPGGGLTLSGTNSYDTDTQILTTPSGPMSVPDQILTTSDGQIVALLVSSFTLSSGATLRITGVNDQRPIGIVSYGHVQIDGLIDLADQGAGARDDQTCSDLGQKGHKGADDNGGASGGGGGALAGAGGKGGDGDKDMNSDGGSSTGAAGGTAVTARPMHVLGGCDGGGGGAGSNSGGRGGHGGGAIFIASGNSITISSTGAINAGGGGGKGGLGNGGAGGGGGSGGMIVLESASVSIMGKLAANGGGGGGGVGFIAIGPGSPVLNNATISPQFGVWP